MAVETTTPLISIITVVYNGQKYLEETIKSVTSQTYENIEYIIIDGGSTDGTLDIIRKYEDKITYWVSERDKGIYDALNKGVTVSNGDWINFMNAGDRFYSADTVSNIFPKVLTKDIVAAKWRADGVGNGRTLEIYKEYDKIKRDNKVANSLALYFVKYWILFKYFLKIMLKGK